MHFVDLITPARLHTHKSLAMAYTTGCLLFVVARGSMTSSFLPIGDGLVLRLSSSSRMLVLRSPLTIAETMPWAGGKCTQGKYFLQRTENIHEDARSLLWICEHGLPRDAVDLMRFAQGDTEGHPWGWAELNKKTGFPDMFHWWRLESPPVQNASPCVRDASEGCDGRSRRYSFHFFSLTDSYNVATT